MGSFMRKLFLLALVLSAGMSLAASDGSREAMRIRLVALETLLAAKKSLIQAKWTALAQLDAQSRAAVTQDEAVTGDPDQRNSERVKDFLKGATRRQGLEAERLQLLKTLQDLYMEADSIQGEIQKVRSDLQGAQQVIEGHWVLTLMPAGMKGDIYLTQNGTLVTGDYNMENGQTGSLQGTFVNNVLVIEKIDTKYGKNGRLEGGLSKDRQSVKGSWFSYDFSSGQPLTGAFSLDRVQEENAP